MLVTPYIAEFVILYTLFPASAFAVGGVNSLKTTTAPPGFASAPGSKTLCA